MGLLFGSFANAVIWRLHSGTSIAKGRSKCPDCHHELGVLDLVPVLSWLGLRGRCRYCHKKISVQYPVVELVTAGLFASAFLSLRPASPGEWVELVYWLYLIMVLVILAVYDLRWMLLPDAVTLPAIGLSVTYLVYLGLSGGSAATIFGSLLAAVLAGGFFYALGAVSGGRWMGGGDVKLVFLMGLALGLERTFLALVVAFNVAAIVSLILIGLKLRKRTDHIPFGPFLAGGTLVALIWGTAIINWYLRITVRV